jgi:hypothetical protein
LRYRGFIRTPNVCPTSSATRGAVHRSVAKPNSVGLRSIQPSTRSTCRAVSFGGRPGRGLAASAAAPPAAKAAARRCTDRTLTPTAGAISTGVSPSQAKLIAHARACSSWLAVHGVVMGAIIVNDERVRHD